MANQLNTGELESLQQGETLLVAARKISGDKIHLEFAESVQLSDRPASILSILNESDARFSSRARRAWMTAEPNDATKHLGINFSLGNDKWYMSEKGEVLDLNILNPTINGVRCRLVINETTEATEWQANNIETSAKRRGKDGDYITSKGNYIFSNTTIVLTDETPTHTILDADEVEVDDAKEQVPAQTSLASEME
tara:strand:+ start:422 stop:1009 length:588 start_codon:yes stop_codon:yes gene_type:complete